MPSRHHHTAQFLKIGLYDNLSSFSDLETRISQLDSNKERGDAFEVFAQGYLATQKTTQAKTIWPFESIPESVKRKLSIDTHIDMGVDGVYETTVGDLTAYQVKFRTGRPSLTWDELSTFMGLTEQVDERVLFTNSDGLPEVMNDRSRFFCIRGNDLDRLEAADFDAIREWLSTGLVKAKLKDPKPHQEEALQDIQTSLMETDRATLVMACGTGKTLVALWAAERLGVKSVLVLVPSLALVRQTLHEWLKETRWDNFSYLCVCSDPSVTKGADNMVVRQSDLDFPVTTDSAVVKEYLSSSYKGVRVIFSTYQSAQVVAEGMPKGTSFDLGLFDEAHKTAGREGTRFSFALKDDNLLISKRLFMTATPRHYDIRNKDKEGDAKLVYSMDVPEIYGKRIHELSFREAATRDLICDYKVVISVVTSEEVNNDLLRRGEVVVQGDVVKARQVANQIALKRAVENYGVKRIFTFHRSVKSAKSFTGPGGGGVNSELPDFLAVHVNGAMSTVKRERVMQEFAEADKAVISNARCLTEGVDLPAVDMVAFMAPKKSKVDIVQATGRAMRKADYKEVGYVMVPLFVEQEAGETNEEALQRTGFDEVWNVLEAMKEQDAVLEDIIRQMREEKGKVGGYDDTRFREQVEVLGAEVSLASLRDAITTLCIEQLGVTWDERYGELVAYKERFGNCTVPQNWDENPRLGKWVGHMRTRRKNGTLSITRIYRLDDIGFSWSAYDDFWEKRFSSLARYRNQYGNCRVPQQWDEDPLLTKWVRRMRTLGNKGVLSKDHFQRLDRLGFLWSVADVEWEAAYNELIEYKSKHGNCNVPQRWRENTQLSHWVQRQRQNKKTGNGILNDERIKRLESIEFIWDRNDAAWEAMYTEMAKYKEIHGDCNVPKRYSKNPTLANWRHQQQSNIGKGKLSAEHIERLEALGFVFDYNMGAWEKMYASLVEYKNKYGNCNVPTRWPEDPKLARWVFTQRQTRRKKGIDSQRIKRLDKLGFAWDPHDAVWEERFNWLCEYKEHHGDCNVPANWDQNPTLGNWAQRQRSDKKKGTLSKVILPHDIGHGVKMSAQITSVSDVR